MWDNLIEVYDVMKWNLVGTGMNVVDLLVQSGEPTSEDKVGVTVELALYVDNVRYHQEDGREEIIEALKADGLHSRYVKMCEFRDAQFQIRI